MVSVIVKVTTTNGLSVSRISLNATATFIDFPQLDLAVHPTRENEMCRFRKPFDASNALRVSLPFVNLLFGEKALVRRHLGLEVHANILWNVEEGSREKIVLSVSRFSPRMSSGL